MHIYWSVVYPNVPRAMDSLASGRWGYNLKSIIFKHISRIDVLSISCEIAFRWMPQELTDNMSTLVQVIAWCRQATSLTTNLASISQYWPRSILLYGVTISHTAVPYHSEVEIPSSVVEVTSVESFWTHLTGRPQKCQPWIGAPTHPR